jgi:hypothetical protein
VWRGWPELNVGTECTLVHCSLCTGCMCRVLTPREPRNQVINVQNIADTRYSESSHVSSTHVTSEQLPCNKESLSKFINKKYIYIYTLCNT